MFDLSKIPVQDLTQMAIHWGTNGFWAIIIITIGWTLAGTVERGIKKGLERIKIADPMLRGFFASLARWAILSVSGIAALERLGVQTTSVVAILGAAGLAVGLALQGTLGNLAAGVMLLLFRPFKVGDGIEAGALTGTVKEVTLFHTRLTTADNVQVVVPNSVLWAGALRNMSAFPLRRLEVMVPVPYGDGVDQAFAVINDLIAADPRIQADPKPSVLITKFGDKTADIQILLWCSGGDMAMVRSDLMRGIWQKLNLGVPG